MSELPIPEKLYFRIGEVAKLLGVRPHVVRFWETEFPAISPRKSASGQRVYLRSDVETLVKIRELLYEEKYSIEGARKRLGLLSRKGATTQDGARELREAALSLAELARTPISQLFHL